MHPLQELVHAITGAPSAKSAARQEAVGAAAAAATKPPPAPPAAPPPQSPVGSPTGGSPSFLAGAATIPPTQQNTATKTLLGQ
jgi:hypothetical protein